LTERDLHGKRSKHKSRDGGAICVDPANEPG
jgi:hypothetical protein